MADELQNPPASSSSDPVPSQDFISNQSQPPTSDGSKVPNSNIPKVPIMYPAFVPSLFPQQQDQEPMNHGPGLYAVPVLPYTQQAYGFPANSLIPFTYNIPTVRSASEVNGAGNEQVQEEQPQQQGGPQRQVVVRRFQIAIQLDIILILKLLAVIFLFSQDGSKQRVTLLVFFASFVYLYQTGALAPVVRWLTQGMQRAAAPPQPPRVAVGGDNLPAAGAQENDNAEAEAEGVGENENPQVNDENGNPRGQVEAGNANRLWVIVKEIQMFVFGFITSLLPGFHNID